MQYRRQKTLQRDAAAVQQMLENRYLLISFDVQQGQEMGRRTAGIYVVYETRNMARSAERLREVYDIMLTCYDHFKTHFDYVQVEARKTDRRRQKIVATRTYRYDYYMIRDLSRHREELDIPSGE
jgi:hypothetical protein